MGCIPLANNCRRQFGSQSMNSYKNEHRSIFTVRISSRNESNQSVIVKSIHHFRLQNEHDVLKRFQSRTPFIRPLTDEVVEPSDPPAIVLRHLDENLLDASVSQRLTKQDIKYVARRILEALRVLHEDNFVHTGKACTICFHISCRLSTMLQI